MKDMQIVENKAVAETVNFKGEAEKYLATCGQRVPQNKATEFLQIAQALKLNPFKREVYLVAYKDKCNILVGYEVYIKRAERTGKLNGWEVKLNGFPQIKNGHYVENGCSATITIHRKDWQHPFSHTVFLGECIQTKADGIVNSMWSKMPSLMIRKVAIAQGFRLCFPDELGGMPYDESELPEIEKPANEAESEVINVTPVQEVKQEVVVETVEEQKPPVKTNEAIDTYNQLSQWVEEYKQYLNGTTPSGNPYLMAKEALETGSDGEIVEMWNRVKKFLNFKGIKVA